MICSACASNMLPDPLSCGRGWERCPKCGGSFIPGSKLRVVCASCRYGVRWRDRRGKTRSEKCPLIEAPAGDCDAWRPVPHFDSWRDAEMFEATEEA